jgi:O-antigen/teichoic acid export membrane protein
VLLPLASFSAFAYLNRLASLAYAQGDKLIIGALAGMSALTYYAVPFTLANRVYGLSYRLSSVILPATSSLAALRQHNAMRELYLYSARYVFYVNSVMTLLLASLAYEILYYWIGADMAAASSMILVLIALGNLLDSLTNAPSLVNDGLGQPKVTGLFAITRAILGLSAVFVLVYLYGVLGAAIGQLIVSLVMPAIFIVYVHGHTVPVALGDYLRHAAGPSLPVIMLAVLLPVIRYQAAPIGLTKTAGLVLLTLVAAALYGWFVVIRPADRDALFRRLKAGRPAGGGA